MSFRMDFYLWALLLLVQGPGTGAAFLPSSVVRQKQGFYASKPALDVAGPSSAGAREYSPVSLGMSELSDLPSILSSVETFDGSTVDPVVVSNVFWGALQGKIISVGKSPTVEPDFGKLLLCIVIDTIGTSSELIPIIGEVTDVAWAPIAGLGLRSLFGSNILFALEFTEEILPFTDILPLATLCWVVDTYYGDSNVAKALGIGAFGNGG
eukprot:CAMPEP_0113548796 /NCGR_PEP_ID=MMETSP0015_2-20120614/13083_1 /TAXON_ID=2838 /ORGANISM="Odontella" /LENGTH=209 /DNA_ID=CAMNT_0000449447 /DNA_START=45 /DNA_END=671 /DNA_ORIENTATION=- /assembly_acc=CAM_ASM_000160